MNSSCSWRRDRVFWFILALAGALGVIYNFAVLVGYAPDEPRHMKYIELLLDERRLPFLLPGGGEYRGAHSLHPPLYYLVLTPLLAVGRLLGDNAWHVVRLGSMIICLASLPFFYDVAYRVSDNRNVARLSVALLGLLPIFGMTAGSVNNDAASLLAFALFLWLLTVRFSNDFSLRAALWLGVALGLGGLCKATVIIADVGALVAVLALQRGERNFKNLATRLVGVGFGAALFLLPWYGRNYALYGKFSPIESGYSHPGLPKPDQGVLVMALHDNFAPLFAMANTSLFNTLWSQKDWFPEAIRTQIYTALAVFCALAVGGNILSWRRATSRQTTPDEGAKSPRRAAIAAFALTWVACLWMALFRHWGWAEGGRYLLSALFGFTLFLATGWHGLVGAARLRIVLLFWCVLTLALNGISIYWLLSYLNPTFGPKS